MEFKNYIIGPIIVFIVIIALIILFIIYNSLQKSPIDEMMEAKTIVIAGQEYSINEVEKIEEIGGPYERKYKIILKNGSIIYFQEYRIDK